MKMRKLYLFFLVALLSGFAVEGYAQGKAPWTMTKQWITAEESENGPYIEAWIFGKKAKGRCDEEPRTICNGGISISYNDKVTTYVVLNYAGKNAKGHIYNATYKQKGGTPVTGKLLIRVKGSIESGPSIHISAMDGTLEGCDVDGITLIGTPTAMDE